MTRSLQRALLMLFFFGFSCAFCIAQNPLYIGLAFGPKGDVYNYYDAAGLLSTDPIYNGPNVQLKAEYQLSHRFQVGSGLIFNSYGERYKIADATDFQVGTFDAFFGIELPVRLQMRLAPWKNRNSPFHLGITAGYHVLYIIDRQEVRTSRRGFVGNAPGIIINTISTSENGPYHPLVEGGLFFNYQFHPNWILGFSGGRVSGFRNIISSHILYSIDAGASFADAFARTKGDYLFLHVEIKFVIGGKQ